MSYYYSYRFVSPEPLFATVKEELKSYFDTGAIDDLMFPTYLNKCLNKLGKATYNIVEEALYVEDFEARLPDNFYAVREAWMCTEIPLRPYREASSFYSQAATTDTIQISPLTIGGTPCNNPVCQNNSCNGECMPELIQAVYKTNSQITRSYKQSYLLKPGNISARNSCDVDYTNLWDNSNNPYSSSVDSFDIRDNKFVTNFRKGVIHLIFYSTDYDGEGNQMIPDNYRIREYVEAFIKFKMFEQLTNNINDETFNQLQQKLVFYKQASDEAFIMANTEIMKQTSYQKTNRIKKNLNRLNMYELPSPTYRGSRRRNY
jgi:hypothetical protein